MNHFVIVSTGRCGSTALAGALDRVESVYCKGGGLRETRTDPDAQRAIITKLFRDLEKSAFRAGGFKTALSDVASESDFRALLSEWDARLVHLRRRNVVKLAVSHLRGRVLSERIPGAWNIREGQEAPEPFAISPRDLREAIELMEEHARGVDAFCRTWTGPIERVGYEDLLTDGLGVLNRVLGFLGVEGVRAFSTRTRKLTSDDLRESIANFDELARAFAGSPYLAMLEERTPVAA